MEQTKQIAERLAQVARELAAIANDMTTAGGSPVFPDQAIARLRQGLCLNCDRTQEQINQLRRGLCPACYQRVNRQLLRNPLLESKLIAKGLLAPSGFNPNADSTPLDELLKQISSQSADRDVAAAEQLAADMTKEHRKKAGTKKKP